MERRILRIIKHKLEVQNRLIKKKKESIRKQMEKRRRRANTVIQKQLRRREKQKRNVCKININKNSQNFKRLQTKKAINHYQEKMMRMVIQKHNSMVSTIVHNVIEEKRYEQKTTPFSLHPPMYQPSIIPMDPKEIVRSIYLRDRLHYLNENYHLH